MTGDFLTVSYRTSTRGLTVPSCLESSTKEARGLARAEGVSAFEENEGNRVSRVDDQPPFPSVWRTKLRHRQHDHRPARGRPHTRSPRSRGLHICPQTFRFSTASPRAAPDLDGGSNVLAPGCGMWAGPGHGDDSLLHDAHVAGWGSSVRCPQPRRPTWRFQVPRAGVPATDAGYQRPFLSQLGAQGLHFYPPVPAGDATSPQLCTEGTSTVIGRKRVREAAAAGHAHAGSLRCTLMPSGDADRQL